jgi:predicted AlkP superfamily phosphohydrolase/phosphomutase
LRALLIIIDGLSYELLEKYRDELPNIRTLINEGAYGRLDSVFPALTPVAIASLITGVTPKTHGITAPKIFVRGRKLSDPISAFSSEGLLVDPIWYHLGKRGKKVIVASSPQALPDRWNLPNVKLIDPFRMKVRRCSEAFFLREGEWRVHGKTWLVSKEGSRYEIAYPGETDYSIIRINVGEREGPIVFSAKCKDRELTGLAFLAAKEEGVYVSPAAYQTYEWSNDRELMDELWERVFKVSGVMLDSDHRSLQRGQITLDDFMWTASLASRFFTSYSKYLLTTRDWDFAVTYFPVVDNVQHVLFGFYEQYESQILQAYRMADEFVGVHANLADAVFVVSDHGIAKITKRFFPNRLLIDLGLLQLNDKDEVDWSRTKAIYVGGGVIRLNVKGREEGGIIRLHEYKRIVKTIVRALEGLEGGKLFASIIENEVPSGDREGDIVFVVNEPYGVSSSTRKDVNIIEDVVPFKFASGDHGYFRKSDFGGVIISRLKGVNLRKRITKASVIDVVPTILKLFGIDGVRTEGRPVFEVIEMLNHRPQST